MSEKKYDIIIVDGDSDGIGTALEASSHNIEVESLDNKNGKIRVNYNDEFSILHDRVISVIGGATPVYFLKSCGI